MLRTAFVLGLSLLAVPALADEKCTSMAQLKKQIGDGVTVTSLSPGQMNWLRGFWMGRPPTLQGAYPGTGAILLQHAGDKGGMLVWTKGSLACAPAPVPPEFVAAIQNTKTGAVDADGQEI